MKVGVFSDIHDNIQNLKKAIKVFEEEGVKILIFCGDFCSPIPFKILSSSINIDLHCVFGNGDGDRLTIQKMANEMSPKTYIHGEYAILKIEEVKIAVTHYPVYAEAMAKTGDYDAVFFGHTHERSLKKYGRSLCVNPGELLGWKENASVFIYDTGSNSGDFKFLD